MSSKIKQGNAKAYNVQEVITEDQLKTTDNNNDGDEGIVFHTLPTHLEDTFNSSKENLNPLQQQQLK